MQKRKPLIFVFLVMALLFGYTIKVSAASNVSFISANASINGDEYKLRIIIDVPADADKASYYKLDFSELISYCSLEINGVNFLIEEADPEDINITDDFRGTIEYDYDIDALVIKFKSVNNDIYYILDVTFVLSDGEPERGNILEYISISKYTPPASNAFTTAATITMNTSSGKGSLSGSIDFSENEYSAGWYAMDLNYVKEYYELQYNISSATFTCESNSDLNTVLASSVKLDECGNTIYFPLKSIENTSVVVSYTVVFSESASGYTNAKAGTKVKTYLVSNNIDSSAMAFSDENYSYTISVDSPLSVETVMNNIGLQSYDKNKGSQTITYEDTNNYASKVLNALDTKSRVLGSYTITFSSTDSQDNTATLQATFVVEDQVAPVLNETDSTLSYTVSYTDELVSDQTLIDGIVASDNYDIEENIEVTVTSGNYQANHEIVGSYNVPVTITDQSGNSTEANIVMNVVDRTPPEITGSTSFSTSYTSDITAAEIVEKCDVYAYDELDGEIQLTITSDTYSKNKNNPGTYQITVKATDTSDNSETFTITVTVTDSIKPYFLINKTTLEVSNGHAYTMSEIVEAMVNSGLISVDYKEVEVIEDNYSDNSSKEGAYLYRLKVIYDDKEDYIDINVKVIEDPKELVKIKWYAKVGNFFSRVFTKIGNFFTNVVYEKGIKKVFNFVKRTWNKIFKR